MKDIQKPPHRVPSSPTCFNWQIPWKSLQAPNQKPLCSKKFVIELEDDQIAQKIDSNEEDVEREEIFRAKQQISMMEKYKVTEDYDKWSYPQFPKQASHINVGQSKNLEQLFQQPPIKIIPTQTKSSFLAKSPILQFPKHQSNPKLVKVNPNRLEYEKMNIKLQEHCEIKGEMLKYLSAQHRSIFENLTDLEQIQIYHSLIKEINFIDCREHKYIEIQREKKSNKNQIKVISLLSDDEQDFRKDFLNNNQDAMENQTQLQLKQPQLSFQQQNTSAKTRSNHSILNKQQNSQNLRSQRNMLQELSKPQKKGHLDPSVQNTKPVSIELAFAPRVESLSKIRIIIGEFDA